MNLQKKILFFLIITSFASSCSKSEQSPLHKLALNLIILDVNGEKRNVLEDGRNFSIGFEAINQSNDSVFVSHEDGKKLFSHLYKQSDFLTIYQKNGENRQEDIPIGKPYDPNAEIAFTDNIIPGYLMKIGPSGSQYVFLIPWTNNPTNEEVPPGNYYSSFQDQIQIEDIDISIDTKIEFKVN